MTDKEKIRAEIERRKKEAYGTEWGWAVQCATYDEILSFIDSLPEEPVSEDLEKAAKVYADNITDKVGYKLQLRRAVVYGAKWKEKR